MKINMKISSILMAMTTVCASLTHPSAHAQVGQPLRVVVPYAPSGLPDALARVIGERVTLNTGQPVVVENKPGASGIIGAQFFLQRAKPDGQTVFLIDNSIYAINAAAYPKLSYQPKRDFAPVMQVVRGPLFLVANANVKANTVQEVVEWAKKNPGDVMFGSPGNATLHHLGMEQFARAAKIKMTHVPYKGAAELVPGLISGDVSFGFLTLTSVKPHLESGRLRLIAVGSAQRQAAAPNVPTFAEAGYAGIEVEANMGFAVAAGTPPALIEKLKDEFTKAVQVPETKARIEGFGVTVTPTNPKQWAAQLDKDLDTYSDLVRAIGLKVD